jgi:hypothetical protein
MSTDYRIVGRGRRLTKQTLLMLCKQMCWPVEIVKVGHVIVESDTGYIHFYSNATDEDEDKRCGYNYFTRFGGNNERAVINALDEMGYEIVSEHMDGY